MCRKTAIFVMHHPFVGFTRGKLDRTQKFIHLIFTTRGTVRPNDCFLSFLMPTCTLSLTVFSIAPIQVFGR